MLTVTPLVGVWIEIIKDGTIDPAEIVTPLVGVWIEIFKILPMALAKLSLPLWECGLKCCSYCGGRTEVCHSPCGSVD